MHVSKLWMVIVALFPVILSKQVRLHEVGLGKLKHAYALPYYDHTMFELEMSYLTGLLTQETGSMFKSSR